MALKTKIRVGQITGSYSTSQINDQEVVTSAGTGSLSSLSLQDALSDMASAIKRIHGEDSFIQNNAGAFKQALIPSASDGYALGSASKMWSDLFLASGGVVNFNNGDITVTHSNNLLAVAGGNTRVARLEVDSASDYIDVDTDLKVIAGADIVLDPAGGDVKVDGNVLPNADDTYDLGSTGAAWQDLYLEGDITLTDAGSISAAAGDLTVGSAAAGVTIDAATTVKIDSDAGDISFEDGGTAQLALDMDGTGGEIIMQLKVASDDFVFKTQGGTEVFRVEDAGAFDIAGGAGSSGVTVSAAGQLTADGRVIVDDSTEATSTTDGSLQTDGGLSVAKSAVIGDDLDLLSNSAIFKVGVAQPFTLTHANANNTLLATANHRLAFGDAGEYLYGDGTDLKIISSGDVDITATLVDVTGAGQFSGNLTVGGNLDINGTTTTIDTVNMTVQDSIIGLGVSGSGAYSATGDRGILFPRGSAGSAQAGLWHDGTRFYLAESATAPGSGSFAAPSSWSQLRIGRLDFQSGANKLFLDTDLKVQAQQNIGLAAGGGAMAPVTSDAVALGTNSLMFSDLFLASGAVVNFNNGDVTLTHSANLLDIDGGPTRVDKLEIDSANDYIDVDTDLKIIAANDVVIDPNGGELKVDGNVVPNSDSADSLGASGTAWANLFVDAIDLNGQGSISLGGTGRIDFDASDTSSIRASVNNVLMIETGGADRIQITTDAISPESDDGFALGKATNRWSDLFLAEGAVINWDNGDFTLTQAGNVLTAAGGTLTAQLTNALSVQANGGIGMTAYDANAAVSNLSLDLDGMTDIGAALADADLIAVDDGAGGTNRKCAMSRVVTYIQTQLVQKATSEVSAPVNADVDVNTTLGSDWTDAAIAQRECYVNGQLMLEGANAAADKDFYAGGSAGRVKFEFGLEAGDVVQFILRAG